MKITTCALVVLMLASLAGDIASAADTREPALGLDRDASGTKVRHPRRGEGPRPEMPVGPGRLGASSINGTALGARGRGDINGTKMGRRTPRLDGTAIGARR